MSTDENKALAFRYFDQRWNHNNDAVIDELLGAGMSPEDEKAHLKATHSAFGNIEFTVDGLSQRGTRLLSDGQPPAITKVRCMGSLRRGGGSPSVDWPAFALRMARSLTLTVSQTYSRRSNNQRIIGLTGDPHDLLDRSEDEQAVKLSRFTRARTLV